MRLSSVFLHFSSLYKMFIMISEYCIDANKILPFQTANYFGGFPVAPEPLRDQH